MTVTSKNWKFDLNASFNTEVAMMAKGSFDLIAAAALMYIDNVFWTGTAKAPEVTKALHKAMASLNYKQSSQYALASAALDLAKNWSTKYGVPHAVEKNVFWSTILAFENYAETIEFIVMAIKSDYKVENVGDLQAAIKGGDKGKPKVETTLAERVKNALDKGDPKDASAAAAGAVSFIAGEDKMTALAALVDGLDADALRKAFALVNDRMVKMNEAAAAHGAKGVDAIAA